MRLPTPHVASTDASPELSRRRLLAAIGAMALLSSARADGSSPPSPPKRPEQPAPPTDGEAILRPGKERIAMVLYPKFTALDVIGPHHVFINMIGAKVLLVAKSMEPVPTDTGFSITPNATFDEIQDRQTLVVVPGGTTGTLEAMADEATMAFLRRQGAEAEWIGSVCTGSLLLAAAGLLHGYKATSHWLAREALRAGGAEPVAARFVEDRNRVTGAGVTAGIDYALQLVRRWRGDAYAKGVQMFMEYDPQPPFDSGTPSSPEADPAMAQMLVAMHEPFGAQCATAIERALARSREREASGSTPKR